MNKRLLFSLIMFLGCTLSMIAQDRRITGKVVSAGDGSPLPGVSVQLKGTSKGTSTDAAGNYAISIPTGKGSIEFRSVGFSSKTVEIGGQSTVNVALLESENSLGEVVVVGYGTQIKRELTGNIAKIKSSEIADMPVTSFDQTIQGKAAGVLVNAGSGKLGQGIRINVRGQSSISANTQPLYVIDGIPMTTADLSAQFGSTNPLADINPQDIESLDILKDASASAIYGSRGANGVVIITTKKGKAGLTRVNFGYQTGSSTPTKKLQFLNTEQYVKFYNQAAANSDRIDDYQDPNDPDSYRYYMNSFYETQGLGTFGTGTQASTNWGDLAYQDAPMSQYDINISSGSDKTTLYLSGQYLTQKGILVGNGLNRATGRINLTHKLSDKFDLGVSVAMSRSVNNRISGDRQFDNPMQMVALPPMTPSIDPTTNLPVGTAPGDVSIPSYYNPLVNIGNAFYNTTVNRNISSVFGQYKLTKNLLFRSEFGVDVLNQLEEQYSNSKTARNSGVPGGIGRSRTVGIENLNTNNFFAFNEIFGKHTVDATLGMSYQNSVTKRHFIEGQDFPSDAYQTIFTAARKTDGESSETAFSFLSYFARVNYKFSDRYLVGLSARIDGSSRFGANNRYGFFPAASAGWVLSEEDFLKNNKAVSFLKLRASYGRTGNAEISTTGGGLSGTGTNTQNFPQRGLFAGDAGYGATPGQRPVQLANPDLSWEITDQFDIGIDYGFLNNRISGEIDYYQKNTSNLLLNVNVPATTGFASITKNVGKLVNKGFEFVVNTDNLVGDFKWSTRINAAYNMNKITDIQGQIIEGGLNNMSRAVEGEPIGTFFTAEYAGVDPANGDALWYKNTKNADGSLDRTTTNSYNQAQRVVVGKPLPDWVGGITNTFSYKGLELSVFFNGQFGNQLNFYGVGRYSSANGRFEDNQTVDQLAAWTKDNPNTNVPEARLFFNNGAQPSSRFILDGSYVRLRNITLAYNLPKSIINKAKISSLRVYLTGQNLATFTNYAGWDPEVNADDVVTNIAQGYDFYTAPQARTITFGLNLGF
ncbi:TonB-linked SusC/RagA family outer membrane protein [Arcicella aurantiaca]|uniref:TonB-linked SusC/RagA family outer membrane protein n=1 Tax=Arcicella aurantiaca TaxID=591202 RepID=A0A316EEJ2_9BACT|nr:TonB-dependent receptor [Arcicella aurantiaca]PWK29436.1 TonB-linked SusC/RagA family outer membrane protein [Arcicella aurantiaca]